MMDKSGESGGRVASDGVGSPGMLSKRAQYHNKELRDYLPNGSPLRQNKHMSTNSTSWKEGQPGRGRAGAPRSSSNLCCSWEEQHSEMLQHRSEFSALFRNAGVKRKLPAQEGETDGNDDFEEGVKVRRGFEALLRVKRLSGKPQHGAGELRHPPWH
jgi:hypothetical protein